MTTAVGNDADAAPAEALAGAQRRDRVDEGPRRVDHDGAGVAQDRA